MQKIELLNTTLILITIGLLVYTNIHQASLIQQLMSQLNKTIKILPNQPNQNMQNQPSMSDLASQRNDCDKTTEGYDAVFIYSPLCPHSRRMVPLVANSSIKWYWVNVLNSTCKNLNLSEFKYSGWVPTFYCLRNGAMRVGEMGEADFNIWVRNCTGG